MKKGTFHWGIAIAIMALVAQPVAAQNKERNKRPDTQSEGSDVCKNAVRSMSESTPQRKSDCQKLRRILM